MEKKLKLDWADLAVKATVLSACLAILAVSIASPLYLGSKIDSFKSEMYQEMRDFHGRLCTIEERNREK
ncbi:MAG: hypothetical protein K940chlam3_00138 [Chlamydiae bacterium]|nr:hypothetical protein [Chlamydiota bacterium]